ncbi:MAG TPA: hypothetical protein PKX92_00950 [Edaphocola sp.]|nr:hypothetical protein [Edaphocola sp.]
MRVGLSMGVVRKTHQFSEAKSWTPTKKNKKDIQKPPYGASFGNSRGMER